MSGLMVENDKGNLLISSDTIPLTYSNTIVYDFGYLSEYFKGEIPIGSEDGNFSVWHRSHPVGDELHRIGIYPPDFSGSMYLGRLWDNNRLYHRVEQHIFKAQPPPSSGVGLQLFDADGVEVYNSEKPILSVIDKVSLRVADSYNAELKRNFDGDLYFEPTLWSKKYAGYSKLGLLFTSVPAGISKTSSIYQVWAYNYNFMTIGDTVSLRYRPAYFFWSGSSAVIELDLELRLEFLVIDLSNVA